MNKILLAVVALFTLSGGPSSTGAVTTQLTGEVNKAMVEQVHQALDSTTGPVTIYITSLGGSLFSAIEIENAIGDHGERDLYCPWLCGQCSFKYSRKLPSTRNDTRNCFNGTSGGSW